MSSDSELTDSTEEDEVLAAKKAKVTQGKTDDKKTAKKRAVDEDSDDEVQLKKGKKTAKSSSNDSNDDEDDAAEKDSPKKTTKSKNYEKDAQGNELIPLGEKRFVTVDHFKGKLLIGIREYYEKDGKWNPGRKGISLSQGQFLALKELLPEIERKMKS